MDYLEEEVMALLGQIDALRADPDGRPADIARVRAKIDRLIDRRNRQIERSAGGRDSRAIPQDVKIEVARRDEGRCVQCGSVADLQFDHKVPWSRGGASTADNIQLLCGTCNRRKGATEGNQASGV
jgi:5-methylcytosine-specific restriction endonuclease McrA